VSVEFAALRQDIYNVKINMIPNNDNYHFRWLYDMTLAFKDLLSLS
jgi:hypothetical protein